MRRRFDSRDSSGSRVSLQVISTEVTNSLTKHPRVIAIDNCHLSEQKKTLPTTNISKEIAAVSQWGLVSNKS
jgi:hypothetical protein